MLKKKQNSKLKIIPLGGLEQIGMNITVTLWDERLTTVSADRAMIEGNIRREDRKQYVDKLAAVFILQGYLDSLKL